MKNRCLVEHERFVGFIGLHHYECIASLVSRQLALEWSATSLHDSLWEPSLSLLKMNELS